MNSTLHQRCKVHTSVLGEKPHLSPVPLFWVCGGPHNLVQANLELSAQPWKCLQGDPDCKGACRGQIFGRRRFSRRNSYGGGVPIPGTLFLVPVIKNTSSLSLLTTSSQ